MNGKVWKRFLDYALFARSKPTFDLEEREPRVVVAERNQALMDAVSEERPWTELLKLAFTHSHGRVGGPFDLVNGNHIRWIHAWCDSDPDSLRDAITVFLEAEESPTERVARFDAAAQRAAGNAPPTAIVWVASVFNFAVDPTDLAMVRPGPINHLRTVLELEPLAAGSPDRWYRELHEFIREIGTRLQHHGIPVRDMIDVQALIELASLHDAWWAHRDERSVALPPGGAPEHLSICAIYFDEASYMREWIEFHRLVGVERFYLYDNGSTDEHLQVLQPYLRDGSVVVHEWPGDAAQMSAYADCLARHRDESRWIAFLDLDEFLFSPTGRPLPEVLSNYDGEVGVVVNCAAFGPSGHTARPKGLVTESYQAQLKSHWTRIVKTIADPLVAERPGGPHHFEYSRGLPVDENSYPVKGAWTRSVSYSLLRVNHYLTKSEEELQAKLARPRADTTEEPRRYLTQLLATVSSQEGHGEDFQDSSIAIYLPALRKAIAMYEESAS